MTTDDTTPVNGAPAPEDLAAQYQAVASAYAQGITRSVHAAGQLDPIAMLIELNVLRMKFNVLMTALISCAETGEKFDVERFDRAVIATLAANAQALEAPKIAVVQDTSRLRRQ